MTMTNCAGHINCLFLITHISNLIHLRIKKKNLDVMWTVDNTKFTNSAYKTPLPSGKSPWYSKCHGKCKHVTWSILRPTFYQPCITGSKDNILYENQEVYHCKNWGVKITPVVSPLFFHGVHIGRVAQYEHQWCRF